MVEWLWPSAGRLASDATSESWAITGTGVGSGVQVDVAVGVRVGLEVAVAVGAVVGVRAVSRLIGSWCPDGPGRGSYERQVGFLEMPLELSGSGTQRKVKILSCLSLTPVTFAAMAIQHGFRPKGSRI